MNRDDWQDWFQKQGGLAALWRPSGLLNRQLEVPRGALGLPLEARERLLEAGETSDGELLLVRSNPLELVVSVPNLVDCDQTQGTLQVGLSIDPPDSRVSALLIRDHGLESRDRYAASDLATVLEPIVREAADRLLHRCAWDGGGGVLDRLRSGDLLARELNARLFELGLSLHRVSSVDVVSEALAEKLNRESELRREADRIADRLEFLELWKREELGEVVARADVEKMASHLRREGMLREMDQQRELSKKQLDAEKEEAKARGRLRRMLERERIAREMEIDSERLEAEIERAKKLEEALKESGLAGMVQSIDEPVARERLLELLIQKEMTPEQIAARAPGQIVESLEDRLRAQINDLATELRAEVRGERTPEWRDTLPPIRRVWMAAGLALYRVDGDDVFAHGEPTPVLPPEDLGYLRSVRVAGSGDDVRVYVGAQGGVLVYRPRGSHWSVHRFQPMPRGRGGVNSVAEINGHIFASHSEVGLQVWRNGQSVSETAFPSLMVPGRSTRGVQPGPGGHLYYSHGADVFRIDKGDPERTPECCGSVPDSVTALSGTDEELLVGTRGGHLYRWRAPNDWVALPFESSGPIFRIAAPRQNSAPGWLLGARAPAVQVLDADGAAIASYRSRNPIRWVAAGRQGVLGVDRFGQHLLVWNWLDQRAPQRRIRVPDQILDLTVEGGDA